MPYCETEEAREARYTADKKRPRRILTWSTRLYRLHLIDTRICEWCERYATAWERTHATHAGIRPVIDTRHASPVSGPAPSSVYAAAFLRRAHSRLTDAERYTLAFALVDNPTVSDLAEHLGLHARPGETLRSHAARCARRVIRTLLHIINKASSS